MHFCLFHFHFFFQKGQNDKTTAANCVYTEIESRERAREREQTNKKRIAEESRKSIIKMNILLFWLALHQPYDFFSRLVRRDSLPSPFATQISNTCAISAADSRIDNWNWDSTQFPILIFFKDYTK